MMRSRRRQVVVKENVIGKGSYQKISSVSMLSFWGLGKGNMFTPIFFGK